MTDADSTKPLYEASVKLCAAIKRYKCLHDQISLSKNIPPKCEEAWQMVAEECNESVEFCKNRWKSLRRCFFDGLKRKGNKYYLHDHLEFLLESGKKKLKQSSASLYNDDTNSNLSESLQKTDDSNFKLKERAAKLIKMCEDDDIKSYGSQTTSADESNDILPQTAGVFIISELADDDTYQPGNEHEDDRRLSFNRSCKRALDPHLINELADEETQQKRPRRSDKAHNKPYTIRLDKMKIGTQNAESGKNKPKDNSISTENKSGTEIGIQCGLSCTEFDDMFIQSIKNQLQEMNGRQKLNFKRKVYQSLLEVFDDANDFPNSNETLTSPNKQPPSVVGATIGELRLMRELVSLVQAAKGTPEIMNAKDKVKPSTPIPSKPTVKMPVATVENRSRSNKSPLSISPTPEDDDLQFFIDDSDEDEEIPLPRSWEEIKTKTAEASKTISATPENSIGLPRRILQKVVRVSGSNGGTIVARDGDKKRIYRIVPKHVYPSVNNATPNKNETNVGRIIVSAAKSPQDPRRDSGVGTFYVAKNAQDSTKANTSTPNFTIRPFNSKSLNTSQPATVSPNNSNQPTSTNATSNNTNGQTIFKNIHPANRILSSSTGYFKMVPTTKTITPPLTPKPIQSIATSTPSASKVMTTKLPVNPMLPPSSNVTTKRIHAVRATPPPSLQRRYSICGTVAADKQNTATTANAPKSDAKNNEKAQVQNNVSQIQISQPVSLNSKAVSSPTASNTQTFPSINNPKTTNSPYAAKSTEPPASKDAKLPVKPIQTSQESPKDHMLETTVIQREIPILETAGTVEADDLDPLFVKAPQIKSEPIDVDDE